MSVLLFAIYLNNNRSGVRDKTKVGQPDRPQFPLVPVSEVRHNLVSPYEEFTMKEKDKTKEQCINELVELRQRKVGDVVDYIDT